MALNVVASMSLDAFIRSSDKLKALVTERGNLEAERARQAAKVSELESRIAEYDTQIASTWKQIQTDTQGIDVPVSRR